MNHSLELLQDLRGKIQKKRRKTTKLN